jgi:hypothetical protein
MKSVQATTLTILISIPAFFHLIQIFNPNADFITREASLFLIYLQLGFLFIALVISVRFVFAKQYRRSLIMFLVAIASFLATVVFLATDAFRGPW